MRKYSAILGNLGNTCDRFCGSYKENPSSIEMLKQARFLITDFLKTVQKTITKDAD